MTKDVIWKKSTISSPCIRNCCLDDNDICVGCFRYLDEITGWHSMNEQQKLLTLKRCKQRKTSALAKNILLKTMNK